MWLNPYSFDPVRLLVGSCYLNPRLTRHPITFYPLLCVTGPPFLQMCAAGASVYFECAVENRNNLLCTRSFYFLHTVAQPAWPTCLLPTPTALTFGKNTGLHQRSKVVSSVLTVIFICIKSENFMQTAKGLLKMPQVMIGSKEKKRFSLTIKLCRITLLTLS